MDRKDLRGKLYKRDGTKCHYCEIEEKDFPEAWGDRFYGGATKGWTLEVDRKDNSQGYTLENCVLACALCNMAKSNIFEYEEFKRVGAAIKEIWQQRIERGKRGQI